MVFLPNPPEADKSLRDVQKIILGILNICLWLFFSHALILNKNPHLWMDTDLKSALTFFERNNSGYLQHGNEIL